MTGINAAPGGPVHWLDGLRCPACHALNTTWLNPQAATVECGHCGETTRVVCDLEVSE